MSIYLFIIRVREKVKKRKIKKFNIWNLWYCSLKYENFKVNLKWFWRWKNYWIYS